MQFLALLLVFGTLFEYTGSVCLHAYSLIFMFDNLTPFLKDSNNWPKKPRVGEVNGVLIYNFLSAVFFFLYYGTFAIITVRHNWGLREVLQHLHRSHARRLASLANLGGTVYLAWAFWSLSDHLPGSRQASICKVISIVFIAYLAGVFIEVVIFMGGIVHTAMQEVQQQVEHRAVELANLPAQPALAQLQGPAPVAAP
ncbi:hypothetical protein F5Y19DRAFT_479519 [Xylariaceae sp. FL1651]|nr:hypothetical protein F5Y19DRAFT_479519 [Xylariaceae sp. FL1651]